MSIALALFASAGTAWQLSARSEAREAEFIGARQVNVTRAEIVSRVTNMTAIVKNASRIEAKATTWGQFQQSYNSGWTFYEQINEASTPVWVVAVSGLIEPPHAWGETYNWGVMVFDAISGDWLQTEAGKQGTWPAFFDVLPATPVR